jgi:hypothetical protein
MVFIADFKGREKIERGAHWLANSGFLPGWHRPHLGHFAAEMLQIGFLLAVFMTRLLYVVSNNDFRSGWALLASATRSITRSAFTRRPAQS